MSAYTTVHSCHTQHSTEQFWWSSFLSPRQSSLLRHCLLSGRGTPAWQLVIRLCAWIWDRCVFRWQQTRCSCWRTIRTTRTTQRPGATDMVMILTWWWWARCSRRWPARCRTRRSSPSAAELAVARRSSTSPRTRSAAVSLRRRRSPAEASAHLRPHTTRTCISDNLALNSVSYWTELTWTVSSTNFYIVKRQCTYIHTYILIYIAPKS